MEKIYYFIDILRKSLVVSLIIFIIFLIICLIYYLWINHKNIKEYRKYKKGKYRTAIGKLYYKDYISDSMNKLSEIDIPNSINYNLYASYKLDNKDYNILIEQPIMEVNSRIFKYLSKKIINVKKLYGKKVIIYIKNNNVFSPTIFWISIRNTIIDYMITAFTIASLVGLLLFIIATIILIVILI